jgi:hypothetical protein
MIGGASCHLREAIIGGLQILWQAARLRCQPGFCVNPDTGAAMIIRGHHELDSNP